MLASDRQANPVTLEPTDDVWVYQFAEDQVSDQYLRVWSSDGVAVGASFEGHLTFSYSCLKFDLPADLPKEGLTGAKLVLTHTPETAWTEKAGKAAPVEARMLGTGWTEKTWTYEDAQKVHPSAAESTIFGTGWAAPRSDDKPFTIEVDLLEKKNVFVEALAKSLGDPSRTIAMALTSRLTPDGENSVYKFYSKANEPDLRPKLVLTYSSSSR